MMENEGEEGWEIPRQKNSAFHFLLFCSNTDSHYAQQSNANVTCRFTASKATISNVTLQKVSHFFLLSPLPLCLAPLLSCEFSQIFPLNSKTILFLTTFSGHCLSDHAHLWRLLSSILARPFSSFSLFLYFLSFFFHFFFFIFFPFFFFSIFLISPNWICVSFFFLSPSFLLILLLLLPFLSQFFFFFLCFIPTFVTFLLPFVSFFVERSRFIRNLFLLFRSSLSLLLYCFLLHSLPLFLFPFSFLFPYPKRTFDVLPLLIYPVFSLFSFLFWFFFLFFLLFPFLSHFIFWYLFFLLFVHDLRFLIFFLSS